MAKNEGHRLLNCPRTDCPYYPGADVYCDHLGECPPITKLHDAVNHPSHYTQGGIECIDAMVAAFGVEAVRTYCRINAFKYLWRSEHKNGLEDLEKARWYINKNIELAYRGK